MNTKLLTTTGLLAALALFLTLNILSNTLLKTAQLDLTENQLYTLSQGSKNILTTLEEPITLRFYLSQKLVTQLPGISNYAVRVQELLQKYSLLAGNKLKLMIIDPEPFSEEEDRAEGYGLQGVPIDESNTSFYFGLVGTNSTDDEEKIAFFTPSRSEFLEYDITQLIYRLAHPKQQILGLMSSLPLQGGAASPFNPEAQPSWMVAEHLGQSFEIKTVATDVAEIPKEIDVLMIVHPKGLADKTLYAIDQFVLKGGRALIFVDPYSEADEPPPNPQNPMASLQMPRNSDLNKLFETWGIEMVTNKVVGDLSLAQTVQTRKGGKIKAIKYPVWMNFADEQYFDKNDIITGKIGNLILASPGALKKKADREIAFTPLIQTSDQGALVDSSQLGFFADPEEMIRNFKPEGQFVVAARITGKVGTAFPEGRPKLEENKDQDSKKEEKPTEEVTAPHLTESQAPINLVIVADTDLLEDRFWVQVQNFLGQRLAIPHAANATFVNNAVDNLSGSQDLISVRNRGDFARPFTKVEDIKQQAEQRFHEKEKELLDKLQETDQKIRSLQTQKQAGNAIILSAEQQQEIERFREEKIKIRKELRQVQHELQKDIERLEMHLQFYNIGLMPLLIGIGGIGLSVYRGRRKRKIKPVS